MDRIRERLIQTFVGELDQRVHALAEALLALEEGPPEPQRNELFATLFRTAHSLKGAAASIENGIIEMASHCLEAIIAAVRSGRLPLDPELFSLFFATADGIRDAGARL